MNRIFAAAALAAGFVAASVVAGAQVGDTLEGHRVDPFRASADAQAKALVLVFVSAQCPISNRYAPELRRLSDRYSALGVHFWLVFPDPADSPDVIRRHLEEYRLPSRALRDPQQALAKTAGATVTPEAVVYGASRRLVYRGRIDDRYIRFGLERPAASRKDLDEALSATLASKPVTLSRAPAVGCYIADLAHHHAGVHP